jgi:glutamate dehydrogenase (NAD(P)+)
MSSEASYFFDRNICFPHLKTIALVDKLFRIPENAYTQIVTLARKQKLPMRLAALSLGIKRVQEAKRIRGLFP